MHTARGVILDSKVSCRSAAHGRYGTPGWKREKEVTTWGSTRHSGATSLPRRGRWRKLQSHMIDSWLLAVRHSPPVAKMASQTQGIQQLLAAEKRAAEKVSDARKREYARRWTTTLANATRRARDRPHRDLVTLRATISPTFRDRNETNFDWSRIRPPQRA